jgi:2-amino-4-hydroxy-6-hydroxymethyldihydropteridine diphosphokinase
MTAALIGLGSNLSDPLRQVELALAQLSKLPDSILLGRSCFYRSRAVGPGQQPDYINAVARLETSLSPECLLDELQRLEQLQGRTRGPERWMPRTLDLDLLLYGDQEFSSERLQIPHPQIRFRNFVLLPMHDIDPGLILPDGTRLMDLIKSISLEGIARLEEE